MKGYTYKELTLLFNWLNDFEWSWTGVTVRKTGARVPFDATNLHEIGVWCVYFLAVLFSAKPKSGPIIGFAPDPARPWYLIWPSLYLAGGRAARSGERPNLWMHFEDRTTSGGVALPNDGQPRWNFDAHDLSKSRVAAAFEEAFGYALTIDPTQGAGRAVEKGEANGIHDGTIVNLPCARKPGKVYQKLVENRAPDGLMEDLRTPCVGGKPALVYIKRRHEDVRFSNDNVDCWLRPVEEIFSSSEIVAITKFCALLKLDWGGLDILRDQSDAQIYIVDANRTDMGPPIALPLSDKLKSTHMLATALTHAISRLQCQMGEAR